MQHFFWNEGGKAGRIALLFALAIPGCHDAHAPAMLTAGCRSLGLCESPRPAGTTIDLAFDTSLGSSCTPETAHASLSQVLRVLADRPDGVVRVWTQGSELSDTALLATVENTAPVRSGTRALRAHRERFLREAEARLDREVAPLFQTPRRRRSPIVETLSRIAMTPSPRGMKRVIVLVTDGREVSGFGDFECDLVPTPRRFLPLLRRRGTLAPGSLANTSVVFTYVTLGPVVGRTCPVTIARATAIENLWRVALTEAGAESVRFERGLVPTDALTPATPAVQLALGAR
jgi:hypothetical protein